MVPAFPVGVPETPAVVDSVDELVSSLEVDPGPTRDVSALIGEVLLSGAADVDAVWVGEPESAAVVRGVDEYVGVASEAVTGGGDDDSTRGSVSELAGEVVTPDVVGSEVPRRAEVVGGVVVDVGIGGGGGGTYSSVQFPCTQMTFTSDTGLTLSPSTICTLALFV